MDEENPTNLVVECPNCKHTVKNSIVVFFDTEF